MTQALTPHQSKFTLAPSNLEEAIKFSDIISKSAFIPREYKDKPGDILVAISLGAEVGLPPLSALQNISVINGRASIWGDAALAVVQQHPLYEYIIEEPIQGQGENRGFLCKVKRKGEPLHTVSFTIEHAKKAGLWGKSGPWTNYPSRMLQMRARGFALRDKFADALKGMILREEAQDYVEINGVEIHKDDLQRSDFQKDIYEAKNYPNASFDQDTGEVIIDSKEEEISEKLGIEANA